MTEWISGEVDSTAWGTSLGVLSTIVDDLGREQAIVQSYLWTLVRGDNRWLGQTPKNIYDELHTGNGRCGVYRF